MSNRLSDAMNKLNVDSARNSMARPASTATGKRYSGLDPSTINAMFPDAAAAIATEKAKFTQQTGNPPSSNRNSAVGDARSALGAPTIAGPAEGHDQNSQAPSSPWHSGDQSAARPKSSAGQPPMGQFVQPPPSAGLRSPRPQLSSNSTIQNTTLTTSDKTADLPLLSPYNTGSGNWASMVNTPMVPNFNTANPNGSAPGGSQADMLANATAMKLAALSTVNNRFALDDVRKYRRARSNDAPGGPMSAGLTPGQQGVNIPGTNVVMVNEHGHVLSREQMLALQAQQLQQAQQQNIALGGHRSRPSSPGLAMQQAGFGHMPFTSPQNNGFLSAYDGQPSLLNNAIPSLNIGQFGVGDPMSNRLSDAMSKLNVDSARNSMARPASTATGKRYSGLDPSTINAMFPDAAAAIATEKAKFTQQTGNPPSSNRNSAVGDARSALGAPTIAGPAEGHDQNSQAPGSPWHSGDQSAARPKSSAGQPPMGQFVQPPPSAGLRSPRPQLSSNSTIQNTTLTTSDKPADLPLLSPYNTGSGNWASMVNTPMVPNFNTANPNGSAPGGSQADMLANATAMKLAALSTVNNRFALDDVRKYRRARSNDAPGGPMSAGLSPGQQGVNIPGTNVVMVNEHGHVLSREQMLALQAQQLQQAQQQNIALGGHRSRPSSPGLAKRLVAPDQRRREERDRADELSRRHKEVRDLKRGIQEGNRGLIPIWMAAAKDLVDDFRSFRKFYTWDKYVKYLGASEGIVFNAPIETQYSTGTSELHELAERLSRNVAPSQGDDGRVHVPSDDDGHRGIPFGEWLELFLDFAISLALEGHGHEAYQVCEAARDSIVFVNSKDFMFLIHVAWAACAIYLGDEEMCVAMARFFTKVQQLDSDSYRMFAALCRLCQSPASWYNSGPVQKYILRQIRLIDATQLRSTQPGTQVTIPVDNSTAQGQTRNLDVCLLTLYGHILFTSTSYTYALNYFLRARSLDPINPMINLSVGLGYIHHGLKRQSENRQYLIMQGLACLFEYADCRMNGSNSQRHEALFTVARSFHMLGLHHLAHCWYQRVIDDQSLHPGVDDSNIDARIELAKIYEDAREDEEALILVTEAIALQGAGEHAYRAVRGKTDAYAADADATTKNRKRPHGHNPAPGSVVRPRYRPKRLVAPDQRRREERDRADELSRRHKEVRDLKRGIQEGNRGLIPIWMAAAKDLVDDFRSFRKFYTWDKYVKYLGASEGIVFNAPMETQYGTGTSELHELAERLSRNVAPSQGDDGRVHVPSDDDGHRGIPFGEWLELFLDFAISLALEGHGHEAYQVCEAARDSIVFVNSKDFMFLIHVAWAACAIYLRDEEMCVAMARFFTKVQQLDSDSYRMFAALCRLCQSPASWYNSGPVQKYILRQIRLIDATQLRSTQPGTQVTIPVDNSTAQGQTRNLDVCLLTLYGHILFTSTSYTYALNYFLRARSLDPMNPMINLSVGLGYIHHGLKRQSENRQYLIMQGLACLFEYADCRMNGSDSQRREALFTVARSFHMLGLHHLAHCWYQRVIDDQSIHPAVAPGDRDTIINAAFNQYIILITSEDNTYLEASLLHRLVL
ncbi:hypothetical protein BN1708_015340 [Verticillium longisporum]|uniref:Transcription factor domain-containing protein n=1 Tax=Verticillium longisporum TaxID=100787 RepID=A0A0G4M3K6_VERLO|nr:hypothetical protein BN1708_015340 [Verticillium longisporum]